MENEIIKEVAKDVAKDVYADGAKPVVKPTGELLGLVPRAIKAALSPLEKWIMKKEYNVEETRKLLEKELENIPPELIEEPEPHIAVPALQYISYCMDNEVLRDMYAKLLANSMNKVVKKGVHPGFIEIIKQLSPDDAKVMKVLSTEISIPIVTLRAENNKLEGITVVDSFSDIGILANCEQPYEIGKTFDNLQRLGLINKPELRAFTDKEKYAPLKNHPYLKARRDEIEKLQPPRNIPRFEEGIISVTDFGKAFCKVCIQKTKTVRITINQKEL